MRIRSLRTLHGPNVYHYLPVVIMTVDLDELADVSSTQIPQFVSNLLRLLPGIQTHHCSRGRAGGFVERLTEGTYMAHIIEHVALELSVAADIPVNYGKTRNAGKPGLYEIVTRFQNEEGMKEALSQAFDLVMAAINSEPFDLPSTIREIQRFAGKNQLGPSAQSLVDVAKARQIPVRRIGNNSLIQLGQGYKTRRIQAAVTDKTSLVAADIAQDKNCTKRVLEENFLPVPHGYVVSTLEGLHDALTEIKFPVAIKPFDGNHGNGVTLNIKNLHEATESFALARKFSPSVILEEMCQGKDYRILVVDGKLIAAAERIPPQLNGDGVSTIKSLIDQLNSDPKRGVGHQNVLSQVEVDQALLNCLSKQGLQLESVPAKNTRITLRQNANLSGGGTAIDLTAKVHPDVKNLCERAARVIGLDICGIDLIHTDISQPVHEGVKIIEINAGPGLRMHLAPSEGTTRDVASPIIDMLYPNFDNGRIPIISVTGTNGKTTVVRMIHKVLSDKVGDSVGLTTTDGIWIGDHQIFSGDTTGPRSAQVVLSDPKVTHAVLEVARGGLLRGGLAYDWSDIGIVTNMRPDHIGQDGIENLDDIIWIKSLVAERVKEGGTVILNADDEASLSLKYKDGMHEKKRNVFLFSMKGQNAEIQKHREEGGSCCWVENGWIQIYHKGQIFKVCRVIAIPATMNGLAEFHISNCLAATSACFAIGVSAPEIAESLSTFKPIKQNRGRLNLYRIHSGYVVLDYGHNSDAISAIGKLLKKTKSQRKTAVFGMPGDRADQLILDGGKAIAHCFHRYILKDDNDLRNRKPRETPGLIQKAILSENPKAVVSIIEDQFQAISKALDEIQKDEIVAIFYEELNSAMSILLQYDPEPIEALPSHLIQTDVRVFDSVEGDRQSVRPL